MDIDVSNEIFEAILNKLVVFPWHKVGSSFPLDVSQTIYHHFRTQKKVMLTHGSCAMSIENALM